MDFDVMSTDAVWKSCAGIAVYSQLCNDFNNFEGKSNAWVIYFRTCIWVGNGFQEEKCRENMNANK